MALLPNLAVGQTWLRCDRKTRPRMIRAIEPAHTNDLTMIHYNTPQNPRMLKQWESDFYMWIQSTGATVQ